MSRPKPAQLLDNLIKEYQLHKNLEVLERDFEALADLLNDVENEDELLEAYKKIEELQNILKSEQKEIESTIASHNKNERAIKLYSS